MKPFVLFLFLISAQISLSQQVIDSTQFKIGQQIGEYIPFTFILLLAIIFLLFTYRKTGKSEKTDFMNDGTIEK